MPRKPSSADSPLGDLAPVIKRRETTAELIAAAIRERLVAGVYGPGDPMRESVLAPQLEVSRPTMREALQLLVNEGLLTHHLHRGMAVTALGPDDVRDLYVVRLVLETGGVRMAATGDAPVASEPVNAALEVLEVAAASGDGLAIVNADMAFHEALVALSGSPRLVDVHRSTVSQLRLALSRFDQDYGDGRDQVEEHRRMAVLFDSGQYDELERELTEHLLRASDRLAGFVESAATA